MTTAWFPLVPPPPQKGYTGSFMHTSRLLLGAYARALEIGLPISIALRYCFKQTKKHKVGVMLVVVEGKYRFP